MIRLALKDLKLFFADRRAMLLGFAIPIALTTLFALAFGGVGREKEKPQPQTIVIADEDLTESSKQLITQLDSLKELDVYRTTKDSAEDMVKKGNETAVLIFRKGFSDSLSKGSNLPIEFEYDGAREVEVGLLQGALMGLLSHLVGEKMMAKQAIEKFDIDNAQLPPYVKDSIHKQIQNNISSNQKQGTSLSIMKSKPLITQEQNSPGLIHAVAGTSIMMLLFTVVGMGASLLEEKEQGTLKKLLYSPLRPDSILFGKMMYVNLISILQLLVMFLFAWIAFGLDILSHFPSLVLMILFTAYACSSFGVLLASVAKTRQQVQGMSTLVVLVMSCIGGSMIPSFAMPAFMQKMSLFTVNYWGIQGFYDIFWRNLSITDSIFLSRLLVLFLIGSVLNIIALFMFRKNILKIA